MLYVICCMLCILGCWCHLGGVLGGHWGHLGRLWGYLGLCRGHLGTTLGGLGRYLGTPWGLGFMVWGFGNSTHTLLKCKNRYRLTPVQRKRSHEKRRCSQALKPHTLGTCQVRSRITPVQPIRFLAMLLIEKRLSPTSRTIKQTLGKQRIS